MSDRLAKQVEDDLEPLFERVGPSAPGADSATDRPADRPKQSRAPPLGLIVAGSLAAVAAVSLLVDVDGAPPQQASQRDAPARPAPAQSDRLAVLVVDPPPQASTPRSEADGRMPAPVGVEATQTAPVLAMAPPEMVTAASPPPVRLASRPAPELVEIQEDGPEPPACLGSADECEADAVAEADTELAEAYRQAYRVRVPNGRLRAVQRSWRAGRGYAQDESVPALLEAYRVRTEDIWALVDQRVREVDGR